MAFSIQKESHPLLLDTMRFDRRVSSLLLLLILPLALNHVLMSAAYRSTNQNQLPSTMITGTVYCDTCFHQKFSRNFHLISGASVMVDCSNQAVKSSFRKVVKTDKDGVFRVRLPSEIGKHIKQIKACSVKLLSSNEPLCAVTASATSSSFRHESAKNTVHVFSSGFFTFRPLNQPELCYQRPSSEGSPELDDAKVLGAILPIPYLNLPPVPLLLPLPNFPNLPPLPDVAKFPPTATPANPFLPGFPPQLPTKKETKP